MIVPSISTKESYQTQLRIPGFCPFLACGVLWQTT